MSAPPDLVLQLLEWLSARPRTYAETLEDWRTSCPRLPVWEDAVDLGFVEVSRTVPPAPPGRTVTVSARGLAALAAGRT